MPNRILVVEDDDNIRELIREYLIGSGFETEAVQDGRSGLERFQAGRFDLVILDILMPRMNGLELLHEIRRSSAVPVLMLTALGDEETQMGAFEGKADDYVTKPFSPPVLIKRVEALLRRCGRLAGDILDLGELRIDSASYKAFLKGADLELTVKEFELLKTLAQNAGRILSRETLLDKVWGYDYTGESRIVDAHIKNLRRKLKIDVIKTVKGVGYCAGGIK